MNFLPLQLLGFYMHSDSLQTQHCLYRMPSIDPRAGLALIGNYDFWKKCAGAEPLAYC